MSQEDAIKDLNGAEVTELEDQDLNDVAGGRFDMDEGDNNLNCGCNGQPDSGGSGNENCGC